MNAHQQFIAEGAGIVHIMMLVPAPQDALFPEHKGSKRTRKEKVREKGRDARTEKDDRAD